MDRFQSKRFLTFLAKNKLFTFALTLCLLFLFLVFYSIILAGPQSPKTTSSLGNKPTPTNASIDAAKKSVWTPVSFSPDNFNGWTKQTLADNSTQYTQSSTDTTHKPNTIIVKDGIIIFQRSTILNEPLTDFVSFLGKPEYVLLGSSFYGPDTVTYIYLSRGSAFVADIRTSTILENLTFKPLSIDEFRKKYADLPTIPDRAQKQTLPDGTSEYIVNSSNPGRSNIFITDSSGSIVFTRNVLSPDSSLSLATFTNLFGQAKWIFKGSTFYGSDLQYYIYTDYGFALIANPQTNQVLEEQTFTPMKIEDYVKKYGDDIPSYP